MTGTPIVVVSGLADENLALHVVQLGAQDFLVKGALTVPSLGRALRHARERKRTEQRLMQLAHDDQLTGLANRTTFHERISQAATRARRRGTRFAVMYLDLDKFKNVNDTLGHDAGDTLLFDSSLNGDGIVQSALAADVNVALKRGEFSLHFRPQVTIDGYRLEGFEGLLRWNRGDEVIPPSVFVPLLEEAGGIIAAGHWAIREGCRRLADWRRPTAAGIRLAINMSPTQIEEPGLAETIASVLQEFSLPPSALELEVTEQVIMRDTVRINLALTELKRLGVRLAVKSFGTGFSSAAFLSRFKIDCLKIARVFVSTTPDDPESAGVIRAIVALGSSLSIRVLADGVETFDQLMAAQRAGCVLAQGDLFGRPMPNWSLPPTWEPHRDDHKP